MVGYTQFRALQSVT